MLRLIKLSLFFMVVCLTSISCNAAETDKTLVSWVALEDLNVGEGSVLTIQCAHQFDGIVFGELEPGKWIAGSNSWKRTDKDTDDLASETNTGELIQMAVVYDDDQIRIYRNGQLFNRYSAENVDLLSTGRNLAVFGLQHSGGGGSISGQIEDARIYDVALSKDQLKNLKPNKVSKIEPYAWWDFEGDEIVEKTGRYKEHSTKGDAKLNDGRLVLSQGDFLITRNKYIPETPTFPNDPPSNWLTYHLVHPGPGSAADPGDTNPIYDYKGRYHLHYIYRNEYGCCFAHVSSDDMVHWKWHPTVLAPPVTGHGMFSGTGFYTKDGTPAMVYHGSESGTNVIAYALDDNLDKWTKPEVFKPLTEDGKEIEGMRYWDPDLWERDGIYYAISGGNKKRPYMKSEDLKNWSYLGNLMHEDYKGEPGIPVSEDISCANMFKIGDKWMLMCISHRLGCRYFLGDFKDEKYLPEFHARMNWTVDPFDEEKSVGGLNYFAPESFLTKDGRRVMWTWLITDNVDVHPTGIQSLPRELELPDDGVLRIKPLRELKSLRYDKVAKEEITVTKGDGYNFKGISGDAVELKVTFEAPLPKEFGIKMLGDENGDNDLTITAGSDRKTLDIAKIKPPFELAEDEDITLRVFIDKNVIEVFANDRQAAVVAHSDIRKNPNISFFTKDAPLKIRKAKAWKMKSAYE